MSKLPPTHDAEQLASEFRLVPVSLRADAAQEAWLAYLAGRSPVRALKTYVERERRYRQRMLLV